MDTNPKKSKDYLCVALDGFDPFLSSDDLNRALNERLRPISNNIGWAKVGMELFYSSYGKLDVLELVKRYGVKIFLDLKVFDISYNTVRNTVKHLACNPAIEIINVHAFGGVEMMKAALEGADEASQMLGVPRVKIIGVTVLTDKDKVYLREIGIYNKEVHEQVLTLAELCAEAKIDGIVSSALDLPDITPKLPSDFIYVNPGVRLAGDDTTGQKRIATPDLAMENGSGLIVVGRPIYDKKTPEQQVETVMKINKLIQAGLLKKQN